MREFLRRWEWDYVITKAQIRRIIYLSLNNLPHETLSLSWTSLVTLSSFLFSSILAYLNNIYIRARIYYKLCCNNSCKMHTCQGTILWKNQFWQGSFCINISLDRYLSGALTCAFLQELRQLSLQQIIALYINPLLFSPLAILIRLRSWGSTRSISTFPCYNFFAPTKIYRVNCKLHS